MNSNINEAKEVRSYFVVLQKKVGKTLGSRTWTNFGTKEQLDAELQEAKHDKNALMSGYVVIAEGVAADTATNLCSEVPALTHFAAAMDSMNGCLDAATADTAVGG